MNGRQTLRIRSSIAVLLFSVYVLFIGCSGDKAALTQAEQVLSRHFDAIRRNDIDAAMADYAPEFFRQPKRNRDTWRASLAQLGKFQTYTIYDRSVGNRTDSGGPGTYVRLHCQTTYATASYQEDFELFRIVGTTNFVITRHDFD
jgi:hypothetical protein